MFRQVITYMFVKNLENILYNWLRNIEQGIDYRVHLSNKIYFHRDM